jgi:hypothetical protein
LIAHCFCFCVCKPEGWRRGWTRKGRVAEEEEEEAVMSSSSCNNGAQELTAAVNNSPVDIVILTNGPSEIAAWVKPLVAALRQHTNKHFSDIRILVLLAPCPHASGGEFQLLQTFYDIDRCQVCCVKISAYTTADLSH